MDTAKIEKAFKEAGIEKVLTCPQAFAIAEKHKIPKMRDQRILQLTCDQDSRLPAGLL